MQTSQAFVVLWQQIDPRGMVIPMRVGRDRKTATAWGDGWENFGYAHLSKGHLGVGKDWLLPAVMIYWVRKALRSPSGIFPDPGDHHNEKYILCDEFRAFGHGIRITTTVVVDMRAYNDGLPLGVKTAFQNVEAI